MKINCKNHTTSIDFITSQTALQEFESRSDCGQSRSFKPFLRFFSVVAFILLIGTMGYSQSPLEKGSNQFNGGVGLSGWGLPVYIGFDHGFHPDISLGGEVSFRSYRENWKNLYYEHSIIGLSGNANYHFNRLLEIPSQWNFYGGLNLGFYLFSSPGAYAGPLHSGLRAGAQLGGRYFINDKVGLNLEFGGGLAFGGGKFGVTVKI